MNYKVKIFHQIIYDEWCIHQIEREVMEFVSSSKSTVTWLTAAGKSFGMITAIVEWKNK